MAKSGKSASSDQPSGDKATGSPPAAGTSKPGKAKAAAQENRGPAQKIDRNRTLRGSMKASGGQKHR